MEKGQTELPERYKNYMRKGRSFCEKDKTVKF